MIHSKPFNWANKIVRTVFKGKPYIFSAQDLNRQIDLNSNYVNRVSDFGGLIRENWKINVLSSVISDLGSDKGLAYSLQIAPEINGLDKYVFAKGVRFLIPTMTITGTQQVSKDFSFEINVYLFAKKVVKTFVDDATLCGIRSTEFPTLQPSADVEVWQDERISTDPTVASGEELVGIIFTYTEQWRTNISTGAKESSLYVRYNALKPNDISNLFPNEYSYLNEPLKNNNSLSDALWTLSQYVLDKFSKANFDMLVTLPKVNSALSTGTMVQRLASVSQTSFDALGTEFYILGEGNIFTINISTLDDVKIKNFVRSVEPGVGYEDFPQGSLIIVNVVKTGTTAPAYITDNDENFKLNLYNSTVALPDQKVLRLDLVDGEKLLLYKSATYWQLISAMGSESKKYSLRLDQLTVAIQDILNAIPTLADDLALLAQRCTDLEAFQDLVEGVWSDKIQIDNTNFQAKDSEVLNFGSVGGNYRYKIIGKSLYLNLVLEYGIPAYPISSPMTPILNVNDTIASMLKGSVGYLHVLITGPNIYSYIYEFESVDASSLVSGFGKAIQFEKINTDDNSNRVSRICVNGVFELE